MDRMILLLSFLSEATAKDECCENVSHKRLYCANILKIFLRSSAIQIFDVQQRTRLKHIPPLSLKLFNTRVPLLHSWKRYKLPGRTTLSSPRSFCFADSRQKFPAFHREYERTRAFQRRFVLHFSTPRYQPSFTLPRPSIFFPNLGCPCSRLSNDRPTSRSWRPCAAVAVKTPQCRARRTLENALGWAWPRCHEPRRTIRVKTRVRYTGRQSTRNAASNESHFFSSGFSFHCFLPLPSVFPLSLFARTRVSANRAFRPIFLSSFLFVFLFAMRWSKSSASVSSPWSWMNGEFRIFFYVPIYFYYLICALQFVQLDIW